MAVMEKETGGDLFIFGKSYKIWLVDWGAFLLGLPLLLFYHYANA